MNLPYYFSSQFIVIQDLSRNESYPLCTRKHTEIYGVNVLKFVATTNFVVWYAFPLLVLLCIYATIGIVVGRAASLTKASANKLLPLRGSEKSWRSESSAGGVSVEKRRKVGRLAIGIVLSFALLTLPRYVYSMWSLWRDPTSLNPILYAFLSVRFRQCIKDTFGCNNKGRNDAPIELPSRFQRNRFGRGFSDGLRGESPMPVDYRWLTLKEGKKLGYSLTKVGNCVPCIVKDEDKCEAIGLIEIDGETMLARVGHGTRQCRRIITDLSGVKALFKKHTVEEKRARSNSRSRKA
ncbi:hypothetical protein WR25_14310 isoform C [Diploscapter pachys]|uniref:G-protein coupled receptors family 1 profile domain-containing protein n=1 Tax=Diploscapter pachys TaxID=2018661 RepID=A0A2A2KH75_9BILA|nr:hypothetical protein WR25_14310 isoform B [Diploscapter pachys]PAV73221.1 hypothetical protein WR25_14310 isoform C [Diploscapter pachys]